MVILNCLKELEGMGWCEGCEGCEWSYEMVVCDWGMQLKTSTEPIPAFSIYYEHLQCDWLLSIVVNQQLSVNTWTIS